MRSKYISVSRTQVLPTKISQTCESVRDIKKRKEQLAFHKTSNTPKRTTSCPSPLNRSTPHSGTGDGGDRDDSAKKSSSSTSSSLGDTRSPDNPAHRDPTSPAPGPAPISKSPSPDGCPHSPPPADEEGSSPASEDAGKDPWEHNAAARKATASCSCRSIQRLASEDLKKGSGGDSSSESMSPKTPSESHSRRSGRVSGIRVYGSPFSLSFILSLSFLACSNGLHALHSLFIHLNVPPIVCSMRPVSGTSPSLCD